MSQLLKEWPSFWIPPFSPPPPSISVSYLPPCKEKGDDSLFLCGGLYVRLGLPLQNHSRLESEKTGGACCQAIFLPVPRDAGDALTLPYWNSDKLPKLLWSVHSLSAEQQRCLAALSLAGISESLCDHWLCDEQQLPTLTFTSQDQWKCPAPAEAWGCIYTSETHCRGELWSLLWNILV